MSGAISATNDISRAATCLLGGGLVAFPTETVYGLGADATSPDAVARIYAVKGRPQFNPLIAHVASLAEAEQEGRFTPEARRLAEAFWPGPLTLVLPRTSTGSICDLACAGLDSVGLRSPDHPLAIALLQATARPLAAPSANPSGRVSPTLACHVTEELGSAVDIVIDGGPCQVGVESTIVACLNGTLTLLRPGGIEIDAIEAIADRSLTRSDTPGIVAPGMMTSHYAPRAGVRLDATTLDPDDVGLDFGGRFAGRALDLSPRGDLTEAAANLYRHLRALDTAATHRIAVAPIPETGLGAAINDRLRRAAAPRS